MFTVWNNRTGKRARSFSEALFALIFRLTNYAIDLEYDPAGQEPDGGARFGLTLKPPLFIRRLRCSHRGLKGSSYCMRCEQVIK